MPIWTGSYAAGLVGLASSIRDALVEAVGFVALLPFCVGSCREVPDCADGDSDEPASGSLGCSQVSFRPAQVRQYAARHVPLCARVGCLLVTSDLEDERIAG